MCIVRTVVQYFFCGWTRVFHDRCDEIQHSYTIKKRLEYGMTGTSFARFHFLCFPPSQWDDRWNNNKITSTSFICTKIKAPKTTVTNSISIERWLADPIFEVTNVDETVVSCFDDGDLAYYCEKDPRRPAVTSQTKSSMVRNDKGKDANGNVSVFLGRMTAVLWQPVPTCSEQGRVSRVVDIRRYLFFIEQQPTPK